MHVGRDRKHNKGLPKRVYFRRGVYFYVRPTDGKWLNLGKTEQTMFAALAKIGGQGPNELAGLFDRYAREVLPTKSPRTAKDQAHQLTRLRETFANFTRPDQITAGDVADYLTAHSAPVMANREIALLSHIFTKAVKWRLVSENPCAGVERNRVQGRTHYVEDWDFWLAWVYAPPYVRNAMELALVTGQRQADVLKMRAQDIRPEGIYVRQGKTGRQIIVGWTPRLRQLVDSLPTAASGSVWLLANAKGQRYTLAALRTAWTRLMMACPCERFQFRDIRAKSGTDHETGKHLGHKSEAVLAKHYRLKPEVLGALK